LRLSAGSVHRSDQVTWSATGPAGVPIALGVDVAGYTRATGGGYLASPAPGVALRNMQAVPVSQNLSGCRVSGQFAVTVPAGEHVVALFELSGATATKLASATLTVKR
jgi:hypothetical protein